MSTTNHLSMEERIKLVDGDRARKYGQILITFVLIGFSLGFVAYYAYTKADDQFLLYMATGMLGVLFAGIGAAYSIMGLGRTVGSKNGSNPEHIEAMLTLILAKNNIPLTPEVDNTFFEDNRGDDIAEDVPEEVPPGKGLPVVDGISVTPSKLQYLADSNSWRNEIKTIDGKPVVLIATQISRRGKRTVYVYHIVGTNVIIYNRSRYGIFFMRIAYREENMQNFFEVFVQPPLTTKEKEWLDRYSYELV